eukprot:599975-Pelagomonas_calceolata.AAC.9
MKSVCVGGDGAVGKASGWEQKRTSGKRGTRLLVVAERLWLSLCIVAWKGVCAWNCVEMASEALFKESLEGTGG